MKVPGKASFVVDGGASDAAALAVCLRLPELSDPNASSAMHSYMNSQMLTPFTKLLTPFSRPMSPPPTRLSSAPFSTSPQFTILFAHYCVDASQPALSVALTTHRTTSIMQSHSAIVFVESRGAANTKRAKTFENANGSERASPTATNTFKFILHKSKTIEFAQRQAKMLAFNS